LVVFWPPARHQPDNTSKLFDGTLRSSVEKTRARNDIGQTTSVAPTDAAQRHAILDRCTQTDARNELQYLAFGAHAS
jgi:hypothetical protein